MPQMRQHKTALPGTSTKSGRVPVALSTPTGWFMDVRADCAHVTMCTQMPDASLSNCKCGFVQFLNLQFCDAVLRDAVSLVSKGSWACHLPEILRMDKT